MTTKWKKTPEGLVALFHEVLPDDPRAERRKMFGYPCSFVNGNLWAGLHQDDLLLRLDEASRKELLAVPEARVFEPMPGRPMREYIVVPAAMLEEPAELRAWIARAFAFAVALPGKGTTKTAKSARPPAEKKKRPAKTKTAKTRTG